MEQLSVRVEDTATGRILDELPYTKLSCGQTMNDTKSFSVEIPVTEPQVGEWLVGAQNRRLIHVDQGGRLIYSGFYTVGQLQGDRYVATGPDLFGILNRHDLHDFLPYVTQEQFDIVSALVAYGAADGGVLGVQVRRNPTNSGVIRTVGYSAADRKSIGDAISELAEANQGFEWMMNTTYNGSGGTDRFLDLWYPQVGRVTTITWDEGDGDRPGQITVDGWVEDGSQMANRVWTLGKGEGTAKIIGSSIVDPGAYPRLDAVLSRTDVDNQALADSLALGERARRTGVAATMSVTLIGDAVETVGDWIAGDQVFIKADRLGIASYWRVMAWNLTDGDDGTKVAVDLAFGLPLGKPVRTPVQHMEADYRELLKRVLRMEGR